jgi:hypothetical protein
MGPVPIRLDNHREQLYEASTHPFSSYKDTNLHAKT